VSVAKPLVDVQITAYEGDEVFIVTPHADAQAFEAYVAGLVEGNWFDEVLNLPSVGKDAACAADEIRIGHGGETPRDQFEGEVWHKLEEAFTIVNGTQ
jgi:hypothetical protein